MITKKNSTSNTRKSSTKAQVEPSNITRTAKENGNYLKLSTSSVYFFGITLLLMTFVSGYFIGKSGSSKTATQPAAGNNAAGTAQQQAQQIPAKPQISMDTIKGLFSKDIVKFGNGNKKLLLVEVSDPSCPYCQAASGANKEIGKQIGPQFTLVSEGGTYVAPVAEMKKLLDQGKADYAWIYSPGHGNGEMGAKALYCAQDQGKFWAAHELLMSPKGYDLMNVQVKNDKTKSQQVADFLASAVDAKKLKACLDGGKFDSQIQSDTALANTLGVNGTPGFFVNTTNYAGAYSWNEMKATADSALK